MEETCRACMYVLACKQLIPKTVGMQSTSGPGLSSLGSGARFKAEHLD